MLSLVFLWLLSNKAGLPGIESRCVFKFTSLSALVHQKPYPGWSQYLILPPVFHKVSQLGGFVSLMRLHTIQPYQSQGLPCYLSSLVSLIIYHSSARVELRSSYRIRPHLNSISSKMALHHRPPAIILLAVAKPYQRQALHHLSISILPYNLLAYTQC